MKMKTPMLLCMLIFFNELYAQKESKDSVLVTLEIIDNGNPVYCSDVYKNCDNNNYFARGAVINNTDSTVSFYMYNCAWPESWVCSVKNISFYYLGCDSNFPIKVTLKPKKSLVFHGIIRARGSQELSNKKFKMGFLMMDYNEVYQVFKPDRKVTSKIYWSNPVGLDDWTCDYKIDGSGDCHDVEIK